MRRHIAPRTHRARASNQVALVDLRVRRSRFVALLPHPDERQTQIPEETPPARPVTQVRPLEPPVIAPCLFSHAKPEHHAPAAPQVTPASLAGTRKHLALAGL